MSEILPCAHCGNEAEKMRDNKGNRWVECTFCGASSYRSDHITYAIRWWNTRVDAKVKDE